MTSAWDIACHDNPTDTTRSFLSRAERSDGRRCYCPVGLCPAGYICYGGTKAEERMRLLCWEGYYCPEVLTTYYLLVVLAPCPSLLAAYFGRVICPERLPLSPLSHLGGLSSSMQRFPRPPYHAFLAHPTTPPSPTLQRLPRPPCHAFLAHPTTPPSPTLPHLPHPPYHAFLANPTTLYPVALSAHRTNTCTGDKAGYAP